MKRMKAFAAALLLFLVTVTACHFYIAKRIRVDNTAFSTWAREEKSISLMGLSANMNEGSMPVFGSSEFQHGRDTIYHPQNLFAETRFNPMLIGAGYYQSLGHSITLAAIEPSMTVRKAVLILSPQWFRKPGVLDQAYTSRFAEILYAGMLQNPKVSEESKAYISERTHKLLAIDEKTLEHVDLHEKVLWKQESSEAEQRQEALWNAFLKEKDLFSTSFQMITAGIRKGSGLPSEENEPDWSALLAQAEKDGQAENQNEFFITDETYQRLVPHLPEKKDMNADAFKGYQYGPEFDDLRQFLTICQETGIEPMLVILPVNGYYYDYTGFPKEAREKYYQKIRDLAAEFDAKTADFADQEYTEYFFEDRVHIGKTGWVMVNESLYEFYKQD
ncbi:MAG: D-alanyl-lipoteichoic acid biosynthesis protein DltD [Clostridiales bacterium]|nr:D-alanyl-lipoteichoic acid biosynthesis protein DltD [Candidatus Blautia equi]